MLDNFPAMKRIKGSFRASFALIILAAAGLVLAQTKTEPLRLYLKEPVASAKP